MLTLGERIKSARLKAGVTKSALAKAAGVSPSAVTQWENGDTKVLKSASLLAAASVLKVNYDWLATGKGEPRGDAAEALRLSPEELDLLERYRSCDKRWQLSLRLLSYVATEDQHEVAGDVNIVLARVFGKRPQEINYVSNRRVEQAFGEAPHVAARRTKTRETK